MEGFWHRVHTSEDMWVPSSWGMLWEPGGIRGLSHLNDLWRTIQETQRGICVWNSSPLQLLFLRNYLPSSSLHRKGSNTQTPRLTIWSYKIVSSCIIILQLSSSPIASHVMAACHSTPKQSSNMRVSTTSLVAYDMMSNSEEKSQQLGK